jgi:superfamily I DNA/RNA helicase
MLAAQLHSDDSGDENLWQAAAQAHLEEERRLAYVAATRAKDQAHVSYVQPSPPCLAGE